MEPVLLSRVAFPSENGGGNDGTRNSTLAVGCTDPGDHSVVVVLRPLTNRGGMNEVHQLANALLTVVFAAAMFVVGHL